MEQFEFRARGLLILCEGQRGDDSLEPDSSVDDVNIWGFELGGNEDGDDYVDDMLLECAREAAQTDKPVLFREMILARIQDEFIEEAYEVFRGMDGEA